MPADRSTGGAPDPHRCLSVVVPCYDERATVADLVHRVLASPWVHQLVLVDDGSTDGTAEIVDELAGIDERIEVVHHERNRGKGAALRTGFARADGPYVIVQDADLEYDPDEYGDVIGPLVDGRADVVFGSRFVSSRPHRVLYYWHSVGNKVLTHLSNMTTDLNLTDMETCFKAFRLDVLRSIELEEDRFGFEPEITAKVAALGVPVFEVGISYTGRTYADGKKIGWRDGLRAVWCIAKYAPPVARRRSSSTSGRPTGPVR